MINSIRVLKVFKIQHTEKRSKILNLIISMTESPFVIDDLVEEIQKDNFQITRTSVTHILRLFTVRGVVMAATPRKTMMRGRPPASFIISPKTLLAIDQSSREHDIQIETSEKSPATSEMIDVQ